MNSSRASTTFSFVTGLSVFVFGSNDYFGPRPKNPARYLVKSSRRSNGEPLPWRDLRAAFLERKP